MTLIFLIKIYTIFFYIFLTNFSSSVKFVICSRISSSEGLYDMETSLTIYHTSPWICFCVVEVFSGGFSQTNCSFNFNINVNIIANSYMNSRINFRFSQLLQSLLVFKIMKLESTSKISAQFKTIPLCLLFFLIRFYLHLSNKLEWG